MRVYESTDDDDGEDADEHEARERVPHQGCRGQTSKTKAHRGNNANLLSPKVIVARDDVFGDVLGEVLKNVWREMGGGHDVGVRERAARARGTK